jgi:hypothetical protein
MEKDCTSIKENWLKVQQDLEKIKKHKALTQGPRLLTEEAKKIWKEALQLLQLVHKTFGKEATGIVEEVDRLCRGRDHERMQRERLLRIQRNAKKQAAAPATRRQKISSSTPTPTPTPTVPTNLTEQQEQKRHSALKKLEAQQAARRRTAQKFLRDKRKHQRKITAAAYLASAKAGAVAPLVPSAPQTQRQQQQRQRQRRQQLQQISRLLQKATTAHLD